MLDTLKKIHTPPLGHTTKKRGHLVVRGDGQHIYIQICLDSELVTVGTQTSLISSKLTISII